MHRFVIVVLALVLVTAPVLVALPATAQELKTDQDKALYALGATLGSRLGSFALTPAELEFVKAGLADSALGKPKLDPMTYRTQIQQLQASRAATIAAAEKKAGEGYLAKAAAEQGAKRTSSGLVIKTITAGTGPSPKPTDKVKVHYHGTLTDGTVFDSSVQRGQPATFPLNGVIKCWTEGVQLMKVGGKSRLTCPPDLAYGDAGAPPRIKPGATLVFEVELLEIVPE
jgi:FKBP-type peptidyl-prolyl cis-trans isomerase FkpA/FKBP-type peptidyl-prolyl cis-trans isomerase FklB